MGMMTRQRGNEHTENKCAEHNTGIRQHEQAHAEHIMGKTHEEHNMNTT